MIIPPPESYLDNVMEFVQGKGLWYLYASPDWRIDFIDCDPDMIHISKNSLSKLGKGYNILINMLKDYLI